LVSSKISGKRGGLTEGERKNRQAGPACLRNKTKTRRPGRRDTPMEESEEEDSSQKKREKSAPNNLQRGSCGGGLGKITAGNRAGALKWHPVY